jgi:CHAT domain-containing protein/tetratricopeptide (TPR) repeat protein
MQRRNAEGLERSTEAAVAAEEIGWLASASRAYADAHWSAALQGDWPAALRALKSRLRVEEERERPLGIAEASEELGALHCRLGRHRTAPALFQRALDIYEAHHDRATLAAALVRVGNSQFRCGHGEEAMASFQRSLGLWEELGDQAAVARTLGSIGNVHHRAGEYRKALEAYDRGYRAAQASGDLATVARALGSLGLAYQALGDYPKALECQQRSLDLSRQAGSETDVSRTLANLGNVLCRLGRYAEALARFQDALRLAEEQGDRRRAARTLLRIGVIYAELGNAEEGLRWYERAVDLAKTARDGWTVTTALLNMGHAHRVLGDAETALEEFEEALAFKRSVRDRAGEARALVGIGGAHHLLGAYDEALSYFQEALEIRETIHDRVGIALTLANMGIVERTRGDLDLATQHLERAVREAERLRHKPLLAWGLRETARTWLQRDEPLRALMAARRAVSEMDDVIGRLADHESALAREPWADVFAVGALAAARLGDVPETVFFLETGRAGALLESLGGRQAMEWAGVPEKLARAEREARAEEVAAATAHRRAMAARNLDEIRSSRQALDAAQARVQTVVEAIQRTAKQQAEVFYPTAATMEELQEMLGHDEQLVLYAFVLDEVLAVVLGREVTRVVTLGRTADISRACEEVPWQDARADHREAVATLRRLIVEPLGLPDTTKRVLVSPAGPLSYVPFAALLSGRETAFVQSGTTYALLQREIHPRGESVLALGDPAYDELPGGPALALLRGAERLERLPGSRAEAEAVGETVLLGADATEGNLRDTVTTRERWRAIHFACHGLVDPDKPMLSSVALIGDDENDGFLTCLEVFRMKLPADLAVLSACETGRGQRIRAEGIHGLTRAFMFAGSSRVICSLWKVDDAATRVLMTKFYALWNPEDGSAGLSAAAALKEAQAHVSAQEGWEHPHYWAAWVLWGLPD